MSSLCSGPSALNTPPVTHPWHALKYTSTGVHTLTPVDALVNLFDRVYRLGMAIKSIEVVTQKWQNGMSQAQQSMTEGVNAVTVAPGTAAANARQKWVNAMGSLAVQDKWERNVRIGGSLENWRGAMTTYGIQRAVQGASQKVNKFAAAMGPVLAYEAQLQATIKAMPSVTEADREARALAWMRGMRKYQRPAA